MNQYISSITPFFLPFKNTQQKSTSYTTSVKEGQNQGIVAPSLNA